jgi:malate synthase
VRTVIRYRNGYLNGRGASLLDGYMEDLATDRIYRLMIAQRLRHGVTVADEKEGRPIKHTPELVTKLFDEELERILRELPPDAPPEAAAIYRKAREIGEQMIVRGEFNPV